MTMPRVMLYFFASFFETVSLDKKGPLKKEVFFLTITVAFSEVHNKNYYE